MIVVGLAYKRNKFRETKRHKKSFGKSLTLTVGERLTLIDIKG